MEFLAPSFDLAQALAVVGIWEVKRGWKIFLSPLLSYVVPFSKVLIND